MKKQLLTKLFQCFLLCTLFVTVIPTRILAEGEGAYAYSKSNGVITYYYSLNDTMNASRTGLTIIMNKDWELTSSLNIVEGTTSKIEMNGHVIKRVDTCYKFCSDKEVITMHPNSKLYLYGNLNPNAEYTFNYMKNTIFKTETSGGFVGNGRDSNGSGFYMKKGAKLYLDNVTICGHSASDGAGIYINGEDCEVHMSNGAKISYNISSNGGGIYSNDDGTHIFMNTNSRIYKNEATNGAGIYFNYSWFSIEGDGTSFINGNDATGGKGGGICVNSRTFGSNNGTISGVTVQSNVAKYGGGIYLDQHYTTVKNCKVYGNDASYDGGGIYNNGKNTIQDSEIKGNRCNLFPDTDTNYEGAGIFASSNYDITFKGKLIIKDNRRKNPDKTCYWCYPGTVFNPDRAGYTYDDVFLNSATYNAYILADNIDADSQIGIRTGNSKDRLIVKNLSSYDYGYTFFMNLGESYHTGFEPQDNQLWQRTGATSYVVKVDGVEQGRYTSGTKNVTVVANNSKENEAFDSWSSNDVVSLSEEQLKSRTISFTMPSMEADFTTNYITAAHDISLNINELTVGSEFPKTAKLNWTYDFGCSMDVDITWYKNTENGYQKVMPSDTVQEGIAYSFTTTINKKTDGNLKLAFNDDINKDDVTINYGDKQIKATSFSLNDEGTLSLSTEGVIVGKDKLAYVVPIVVAVEEGITKSDLIDLINSNKKTTAVSTNYNEYDVSITDINEGTLNSLAFTHDFKLVKNLNGEIYYRIDGVSLDESSLDINYNGVTSTSIIINVATKETPGENVYKLKDEYEQDETYWYITFNDIEGNYYSIDDGMGITQCESGKCSYKLTGVKGQKKEYNVDIYRIDDYTLNPVYSETRKYILDDFKLNTPTFNETSESCDSTSKSLNISAYSNEGTTIYYLYNDRTNDWTISKEGSVTLKNSDNAYKTYRVKAWASDNKLVSDVSSSKYVIDNSKEIVYANQIDVTMNWPTIGEKFPSKIDSIKAQLMERTVDIASNIEITSWDPDVESDIVERDYFYVANIKLDLDDEKINLMKSYDIKVNDTNRTFSYFTYEDGTNWLHIIFYGTNGFSDIYNDKPLSYTIQNLTIADYGSISYDEAKQLNNDIEQYDLPSYALLQVINNNDNSESYITADIVWDDNFTVGFEPNNTNDQTIVIKGKLILPSYIKNREDYDTNITYSIKVNGTNKGSLTCEGYMNSKNWTWSEVKKACVYRVSNTEVK